MGCCSSEEIPGKFHIVGGDPSPLETSILDDKEMPTDVLSSPKVERKENSELGVGAPPPLESVRAAEHQEKLSKNIEDADQSASAEVKKEEDLLSSSDTEISLSELGMAVTLHTASGNLKQLLNDVSGDAKEEDVQHKLPNKSNLLLCSNSSNIVIESDNEPDDVEKVKIQLEDKEKKIQELLEENKKLKTRIRSRSWDANSLNISKSRERRSSLRLHKIAKELREGLLDSTTSCEGNIVGTDHAKSAGREKLLDTPLNFHLSPKSATVLSDKSLNEDILSDDGKWACSEMMIL